MKFKILTFFVLQNVMMLLIYHNTFVAFTFTIPERKTKKTFISEGLSEIWIKDPNKGQKAIPIHAKCQFIMSLAIVIP